MITPEGLTRVSNAIIEADVSPLAREDGSRLVQAFIDGLGNYSDTTWETLAVERAWYMRLQPKTLIVGMMDRIARDPDGRVWGCEWKSKKEPRMKKDGQPYKGDTEADWLHEISSGQQVRIYGLAAQQATFLNPVDGSKLTMGVAESRLIVRAVIKATPAYLWPQRPEDGQFIFPQAYIDNTERALINAAEQIRAARRHKTVPHAMPGLHCTNKYNRVCDYFDLFCSKGIHPTGDTWTGMGSTDPGWKAIKASGVDLADPDVVVISASSYANWSQCPEQYRILVGEYGPPQDSMALDTGTVLHAGVAQVYRELMSISLDKDATVVRQL